MSLFEPDRLFSRITAIDVERDLLAVGLDAVLLDIDNTLRSRETGLVPRDVGLWLAQARDAGVSFCLLSNNWHDTVHTFAAELELPLVAKACKPLPFAYNVALKRLGVENKQAVSVGDQLFTDVVGAHLAGVKAYMVLPLAEVDLKHTLLLRGLERTMIGSMEPEPAPATIGVSPMAASAVSKTKTRATAAPISMAAELSCISQTSNEKQEACDV